MAFSSVTVIYNPRRNGRGLDLARKFEGLLAGTPYAGQAALVPTARAGHAEELALKLAITEARPLIVSSSGDGGYHEVINGVLRAEGGAVTGLLPGGNANDHYRNLHRRSVRRLLSAGATRRVDALHVSVSGPNGKWDRFAHSYIGVGLTSHVGRRLNAVARSPLRETVITLRTLADLEPAHLNLNGHDADFDSLVISNVPHMSKFFGLSIWARPDDGRFELSALPHGGRVRLSLYLLRALTIGLPGHTHLTQFEFTAAGPMPVQLDGEVRDLAAGDQVVVTIAPGAIESVI